MPRQTCGTGSPIYGSWEVRQARLVSGQGGFEIVQKAIVAGVPVLASISAPSSLAVQTGREMGLTLIGFLRGRRFRDLRA